MYSGCVVIAVKYISVQWLCCYCRKTHLYSGCVVIAVKHICTVVVLLLQLKTYLYKLYTE